MSYEYEKGLIRADRGLFIDKGNQVYDVRHPDFAGGAKGDGVTDDTAAIQAAIDAAGAEGEVVLPPSSSGYAVASQITNPDLATITCHGTIIFTGSGEHALVFGAADSAAHQTSTTTRSVVRIRRQSQDWSDAFAGVVLDNCFDFQIVVYVDNFETGLMLRGTGAGCAWNDVTLARVKDNRVGLKFHVTSTVGSYVNQNTFHHGHFNTSSSTSSALNVHGVEFRADRNAQINGNVFINPSFEMYNIGSGYTSCFHGAGSESDIAIWNYMFGGRLEETDYLLSGKGISNNQFLLTRGYPSVTAPVELINGATAADSLVLQNNVIGGNAADGSQKHDLEKAAHFGRRNVVIGNGTGQLFAPGRGGWWDSGGTVTTRRPGNLQTQYIEISNTHVLGVKFDLSAETQKQMRFVYVRVKNNAAGGRIAAVCFDSGGVKLTGSDDCSLAYSATEGYHRQGSDMGTSQWQRIAFGDDVDTAWVGITGGTAAAQVMGVEYFIATGSNIRVTYDSSAAGIDTDNPVSDEVPETPAAGDSQFVGTFVRNISVSTTVPTGWVWDGSAWQTLSPPGSIGTYTPTNVTPDRSYNADSTTTAELADVLGTLIDDLQTKKIIG